MKHFFARLFVFIGGLLLLGAVTGCHAGEKKSLNQATLTAIGALSASTAPMTAQEQAVKHDLEKKIEKLSIQSVHRLPMGELYEVILDNNEILYTNAKTEFTIVGHIFNNADMSDLTQARLDDLSKIDFKTLPLAQAFKQVKGNGSRQIVVFEDPNCGYCKMLHKNLESISDITVHIFVIDVLGESSTQLGQQLLCAPDSAQAWNDWMVHKQLPSVIASNCDASVLAKNDVLAKQLGVSGTPTIFFENGKRIPGVMDAASLEQMMNEAKMSAK